MGKDLASRETMSNVSQKKQIPISKRNVRALITVIVSLVLVNLCYIFCINFFDFEIHYPTAFLMIVLVIYASVIRLEFEKIFESPRT